MEVKSQFYLFTVAILVAVMAGCTGLSPDRYLANKQQFMLDHGDPPAFVEGYVDGCSAGRRLAGETHFKYRKNSSRFEKDALYARGWQEGQINCRNEALVQDLKSMNQTKNKSASQEVSPIEAEKNKKMEAERKKAEVEMHELWEELKK